MKEGQRERECFDHVMMCHENETRSQQGESQPINKAKEADRACTHVLEDKTGFIQPHTACLSSTPLENVIWDR